MNIGKLAENTGVTAKTIRYYEEIGLIPRARRTDAGYRNYGHNDAHMLRFIRRARNLGFTVDECRELVALYQDKNRSSADVKRLAEERVAEIDRKISELGGMRDALRELAEKCRGDHRPDCPIIDDLSQKDR